MKKTKFLFVSAVSKNIETIITNLTSEQHPGSLIPVESTILIPHSSIKNHLSWHTPLLTDRKNDEEKVLGLFYELKEYIESEKKEYGCTLHRLSWFEDQCIAFPVQPSLPTAMLWVKIHDLIAPLLSDSLYQEKSLCHHRNTLHITVLSKIDSLCKDPREKAKVFSFMKEKIKQKNAVFTELLFTIDTICLLKKEEGGSWNVVREHFFSKKYTGSTRVKHFSEKQAC